MVNGAQPADRMAGRLAIGIDFGGSGIKAAIANVESGELVGERLRIPTPQPSLPRECIALMDGLVRQVVDAASPANPDALPIGLGFPSAIRNGSPVTAANVDESWIGFPVEAELGLVARRPVSLGNDADLAGLAEVRFGAGRGRAGVILVLTIGTGIGTGLFVDGRLVPNTELGHIEMRGKDAETLVSDAARDRRGLGWEDWARDFNEYLLLLERLLWPDLFILGGGVSKRADKFLQYLRVKTPIVPAELRNNAGIVGATLLATERHARAATATAGEPLGA